MLVVIMDRKRQQHLKEKGSLTNQITRLQAVIKRKYRNFKQGNVESEKLLEQQYKPIIEEIQKSNTAAAVTVKKEIKDEEGSYHGDDNILEGFDQEESFKPQMYSSPHTAQSHYFAKDVVPLTQSTSENFQSGYDDDDNDNDEKDVNVSTVVSTPKGFESASRFINDNFSHPLTKAYMLKLMRDMSGKKQKIDHTFGPRYENDTLMVGNKQLRFGGDGSIQFEGVTYSPTEGLYELLFKRIPDDKIYNDIDLKAYRDILMKTSAHKTGYKYNGKINRGNSLKYKYVISHLFPKSLYGGKGRVSLLDKGMRHVSNKSDIVYWNDPNELCDRLRLLVTSAETGNTNHRNEVISIVEELIESKYISGSGNERFSSLIK